MKSTLDRVLRTAEERQELGNAGPVTGRTKVVAVTKFAQERALPWENG